MIVIASSNGADQHRPGDARAEERRQRAWTPSRSAFEPSKPIRLEHSVGYNSYPQYPGRA